MGGYGPIPGPGPQPPWEPRCWRHSHLWWQNERVPTRWPCPGLQDPEATARLAPGRPFPAEGPAAPDLPFSGADPQRPARGPHSAPAINGDHRPLQSTFTFKRDCCYLMRLFVNQDPGWGWNRWGAHRRVQSGGPKAPDEAAAPLPGPLTLETGSWGSHSSSFGSGNRCLSPPVLLRLGLGVRSGASLALSVQGP